MSGRTRRLLVSTLFVSLAIAATIGAPAALAWFAPEAQGDPITPTTWIPYDPAPPIALPTTEGDLVIVSAPGGATDEAYVFVANEPLSSVSRELWNADPARLLAKSPRDVHYVVMSYAATNKTVLEDIGKMQAKFDAAIASLSDDAARDYWTTHVHYVTENPLDLDAPVADLLSGWGDVFAGVRAEWVDSGQPGGLTTRGTTDSGWAKSLTETGVISGAVGVYGNLACGQDAPTVPITGTIALIERGTCPFVEKATNAARHGATAVVLYTTPDRDLLTMGGTCTECPDIPVVMIDNASGIAIRDQVQAGVAVSLTLAPDKGGAEMLAVDRMGRVRAFGSIPFPFNANLISYGEPPVDPLESVAYEAQYLSFEHERDSRLRAEEASGDVTVVPLIANQWVSDPNWSGARAYVTVTLPAAEEMGRYDTMEVELSLGCQDHWRDNCPAWDYIANLYLCDNTDPTRCDLEFGRWITPYWAEGHWVMDISPLLGLISDGGTRRFAFYTQQRYLVDLSLRLSNRGKGYVPKQAIDLKLNGGAFWKDYNDLFEPIPFQVPEWADKVEVLSVISGHGFGKDAENCAEFCNHTHHFAVNGGPEQSKTHPMAGSLMGCAEQVTDGTVPNQGGTWIYGRGGWCPGLEVKPWVIDITAEAPRGVTNTLTYRGLFNGQDYEAVKGEGQDPNEGFDARIDMRAFLVYSERVDVPGRTLYLPRLLRAWSD